MPVTNEEIFGVVHGIGVEYEVYEHRNQMTLIVKIDDLIKVAKELRDNPKTGFDSLFDVTAIDWNRPKDRFEVVYFLYSITNHARLRLKTIVPDSSLECPSLISIWESANWYERETFDMYGLKFLGHTDLRRFYMPEDFTDPISGEPLYPLRKDFPLMGVPDSLPLPPYPEKYGDTK